jgi:Na+/H+ antiporter NhaD/arsenite permease-like protein
MNVPFDEKPIVLAIFALTYLGLAIGRIPGLRLNRTGIALLGAIGMMIFSRQPAGQVAASINWPTVLLLFGFFVLSAQLRLSGFYDVVAASISSRLSTPNRFLAYLIIMTAILSAFLNNDIVVCVMTPVVATALIRQRIDPVPYLIALAAASNIGAAATLIGNAQNMMIGSVAGLSFPRYMLWAFVPVVVGLAGTYVVARVARTDVPPVLLPEDVAPQPIPILFDRYHCTKGLVILAAVIAFFFTSVPREITVLVAAGIHMLSAKFKTDQILALVEWPILLLFMSLFVVSGSFEATGYAAHVGQWLGHIGFDPAKPANEALLTTGLCVLINNAPAVMLLIKIVPMTHAVNAYVLAVGNSFAGNTIVTASVANIIVVQEARQQGVSISFVHFAKLGVPIMLISVGGLIAWAALAGG